MRGRGQLPRTPAGVTEMEFRRALSGTQRSASTSLVDSAALQSEMSRKYNLMGAGQIKQARRVNRNKQSTLANSSNSRDICNFSPVICACCQCPYSNGEPSCPNCGYFTNNIQPVIETLAQRRGLVPTAPKTAALTPFDWSVIENSRSDPDSCCPICMEGFKQGHEVLLSCSHIFHRTCLRSFENFMKDNELTCPICRTRNYQKKVTHIGSKAFEKVCALKVQRLWRGYSIRRHFRVRLREYYHNLPRQSGRTVDEAQLQRRKAYYETEFSSITDKLNQNLHSRSNQVNTMLRSMDRTLVESQQLDLLFEQMLAERRGQNGQSSTAQSTVFGATERLGVAVVEGEGEEDVQSGQAGQLLEFADTSTEFCEEAQQMWTGVYASALARCPCDCAICMLPAASCITASTTTGGTAGGSTHKRDVVLSCSHIFHEKCIGNFEKFLTGTRLFSCPVCRSAYSKKLFRLPASAAGEPS